MSTVLDALAKADRKTSGSLEPGAPPPSGPPPRSRMWRILALVVLVGGTFVVGMFTGEEEAGDGDSSALPSLQSDSAQADSVAGLAPSAGDGDILDGLAAPAELEVAEVDLTEESPLAAGAVARRIPGAGKPQKRAADEAPVAAENGPPGDAIAAREVWREQRMAARDAARAARKSVAEGDLSREAYREERREQRALMKQERAENQADRRAAQLERRNELRAKRLARAAEKPGKASALAGSVAQKPAEVATNEDMGTESARSIGEPPVASPIVVPEVTPLPGSPAEPPEGHSLDVRRSMPTGAPAMRIQILQWSRDDERRFAFLSVEGGRATRVTEGTVLGPVQVKTIYREMIELEVNGNTFLLRAN